MTEIAICAVALAVVVPLLRRHRKITNAVLAYEKSLYDDSDCQPGFTNYPGPM